METGQANVLDYLYWRGDLSFLQVPFNCVDALILSRLSYIPFDEFLSENFTRIEPTVPQVCSLRLAHLTDRTEDARKISADDIVFLKQLCESERFGKTVMFGYVSRLDHILEKQFSATTFALGDGTNFVGFRGTDNTLIGLKEDLNMSFEDNLPGQQEAIRYLEMSASKCHGKIRVGGHSKGGNFAVFSSAFCQPSIQKRILSIYNLDGPGFTRKVIEKEGFQRILPKIHTYVPQSSIIGLLLEHEDEFTVIHSNEGNGFLQHHLYTWQIYRDDFVKEPGITQAGRFCDLTISKLVAGMTQKDREDVIDGVFKIFQETGAKTLQDLVQLKNSVTLIKALSGMDEHTQMLLKETVSVLAASMKSALPESFGKEKNL